MTRRMKIKHDSPRGWAGIEPSAFDPRIHERYVEPETDPQPNPQPGPAVDPQPQPGPQSAPASDAGPSPQPSAPAAEDFHRDAAEARAKALKIKGAHLMKDETLRAAIAEAEAAGG